MKLISQHRLPREPHDVFDDRPGPRYRTIWRGRLDPHACCGPRDLRLLARPRQLLVRAAKLLDVNSDAAWIVDALLLSDSRPEMRELAAIDSAGRAVARTGKKEPFMGRARRRRRIRSCRQCVGRRARGRLHD